MTPVDLEPLYSAMLTADADSGSASLTVNATDDIDWRGEAVLWHQGDPSSLPVTEGMTITSVADGVITLGEVKMPDVRPAGGGGRPPPQSTGQLAAVSPVSQMALPQVVPGPPPM